MDAVGATIPGTIGTRLDAGEGQMQCILRALGATHRRAVHAGGIPHPSSGTGPDGDPGIVWINSDPVREQAAVHHLAQDAVARILVDRTRAVRCVGPGTGSPGMVKNRLPSASKSRSLGPLNNWLR